MIDTDTTYFAIRDGEKHTLFIPKGIQAELLQAYRNAGYAITRVDRLRDIDDS